MTYSPDKPDSGPSPKIDVNQIRANFSTFQTVFSANHTALNKANQGDHETIIFELQIADPGVTEDLCVLYSKNAISKSGTQPQLFVQIPQFLPNDNDWTQNPNLGMQLTYNQVNLAGPIYQSFLAGGYLIYFGSDTGTTVKNAPIADTIILSPAPTQLILAIATPNTITTVGSPTPFTVSTEINTITNDRFIIHSQSNGSGAPIAYSFGWVAIARA